MKRRNFFKSLALSGVGAVFAPVKMSAAPIISALEQDKPVPETNVSDALGIPRTEFSMPGKYPGKVVKITNAAAVVEGKPSESVAYDMIKSAMLGLTGSETLKEAWLQFVNTQDIIGLKVNPIGGAMLTTSHAVTHAIINQLEESGIPRKNIIIWDRREEDLKTSGFTSDEYPGIKIIGTEYTDESGSYAAADGTFYSESRIDKSNYFYADVDGKYDAETMPYMVNDGKYSYFSKICTEMVTKIINIPVLKNAGTAVTLCMKNLAFGSITNTGRLHEQLWHETSAYACAFPPLRDKVVLNIVDGLIGCFDGGPAANPQFICNYNTLLVGSDPVAVDRIGHEIVMRKRIEEGVQKADKESSLKFMKLAENMHLGIADRKKIILKEI